MNDLFLLLFSRFSAFLMFSTSVAALFRLLHLLVVFSSFNYSYYSVSCLFFCNQSRPSAADGFFLHERSAAHRCISFTSMIAPFFCFDASLFLSLSLSLPYCRPFLLFSALIFCLSFFAPFFSSSALAKRQPACPSLALPLPPLCLDLSLPACSSSCCLLSFFVRVILCLSFSVSGGVRVKEVCDYPELSTQLPRLHEQGLLPR